MLRREAARTGKRGHAGKAGAAGFSREDLEEALIAISSMIHKIRKAKAHLARGKSQWTLARNRLRALRTASALIKNALGGAR